MNEGVKEERLKTRVVPRQLAFADRRDTSEFASDHLSTIRCPKAPSAPRRFRTVEVTYPDSRRTVVGLVH